MHSFSTLRRRYRQRLLRFFLSTEVHIRRFHLRVRTYFFRLRLLPFTLLFFLVFTFIATTIIYQHRSAWKKASSALVVSGTLQQLEIAVGAAMLGVIGIVFSLSIFSIQQVAERGTTLTLREYARDWVFRLVYWILATFAFLAMLSALCNQELAFYGICLNLGILASSVFVLHIYFDRAIRFVDPHFTITKIAKRAKKSLRQIQRVEQIVRVETRYQRSRRGK